MVKNSHLPFIKQVHMVELLTGVGYVKDTSYFNFKLLFETKVPCSLIYACMQHLIGLNQVWVKENFPGWILREQ